ncbi:hypothetical protein [Flavobacterium daejeonense]|uniref:hypothetical protein n=1 Tax=Flavobacterium daejeonense TaxID=350893 RepID=UPI000478AB54|nr:hypothetical protein [Flavobacterium daejeonense]
MKNSEIKKMSLINMEDRLTFVEMENIMAGSGSSTLWGCALSGLAAGVASGMNPLVGGLTTAACFYLN